MNSPFHMKRPRQKSLHRPSRKCSRPASEKIGWSRRAPSGFASHPRVWKISVLAVGSPKRPALRAPHAMQWNARCKPEQDAAPQPAARTKPGLPQIHPAKGDGRNQDDAVGVLGQDGQSGQQTGEQRDEGSGRPRVHPEDREQGERRQQGRERVVADRVEGVLWEHRDQQRYAEPHERISPARRAGEAMRRPDHPHHEERVQPADGEDEVSAAEPQDLAPAGTSLPRPHSRKGAAPARGS